MFMPRGSGSKAEGVAVIVISLVVIVATVALLIGVITFH